MINDNVLFYKKKFSASAKTLFEAFTEPTQLIEWWGPKNIKVLEIDLKLCLECSFSFKMENTKKDVFYIKGQFKEISEPNKLVYTFYYEGLTNNPPESIVSISFLEENKETEIILKQEFNNIPSDYNKRLESWELMFLKLEKFLIM